ncbi:MULTISPECIES: hypothetical protein [unclassified Streptomyces]|uniref:hypothetical protein n=1 Tax=unclassified Streptomyces TaxID=2593676 RepID=UPI00278C302B|nr:MULTISPECIES: hypothetical protein [unclassified Streptomyces]
MTVPASYTAPPTELRIGWIMPPFMHELPLDAASDEEAAEDLYELACDVLPDSGQDARLTFAQLLGAQVVELKNDGALYAGLCFLEIEGAITASTILVTQFEHDLAEDDTDEQLRRTVEEAFPKDDVFPVTLPCGAAVTRVAMAPLPVRDADDGTTVNLPRNIIQTYVPLPGTAELLLFELSLFTPGGWDVHSELFAEVLRTIDWATDAEIAQETHPPQPAYEAVLPDPETQEQLRRQSSRLLDAIVGSGTFEDGGTELATVTCDDCSTRGLRSLCTARHRWSVQGLEETSARDALSRVATYLSGQGWAFSQEETGDAVTLTAERATAPEPGLAALGIRIHVVFQESTCSVAVSTKCHSEAIASTPTPFG